MIPFFSLSCNNLFDCNNSFYAIKFINCSSNYTCSSFSNCLFLLVITKNCTIIFAGMILNFVKLFCGLLSCLMPFLSIIRSTFGKINFDYYLEINSSITWLKIDFIAVKIKVQNPWVASRILLPFHCCFASFYKKL